jgi:hypothetical protein
LRRTARAAREAKRTERTQYGSQVAVAGLRVDQPDGLEELKGEHSRLRTWQFGRIGARLPTTRAPASGMWTQRCRNSFISPRINTCRFGEKLLTHSTTRTAEFRIPFTLCQPGQTAAPTWSIRRVSSSDASRMCKPIRGRWNLCLSFSGRIG